METFKKLMRRRDVRFGCGILVVVVLVVIGIRCELTKSDWAYWVQALGSIGAIVGTWYATKTQLLHANQARKTQQLENVVGSALIAFDLAKDTLRAVKNIESKFASAQRKSNRLTLPTDRLEALSLFLQNFASREISPSLYVEILCLQRELSFTIAAVNQESQRVSSVELDRVEKARKRTAAVEACMQRIKVVLDDAQAATGNPRASIERSSEAGNEED